MEIQEILLKAIEQEASDIFIIAGSALCFKIKQEIVRVNDKVLKPEDTEHLIDQIYLLKNGISPKHLDEKGEDDFAFSLANVGRFRVNAYYQRGSKAAVLRVVKFELPDAKELNIDDNILELANLKKGLVLVTGSAGSGKSTTLACIIDKINREKNAHIITIEDPIEYLHSHKQSIISQREIAHDTKDYLTALRSSLREAPDVILVGEMRDYETIQTAISAAETGHLVLSTLHTIGCAETINRIIDACPFALQQQVRVQLSMTLKAVVSQQLITSKDGSIVPCFEIMKINPAIRTQIRENKLHQIDNTIAINKGVGMVLMDDSLLKLYQEGKITRDDVICHASNPEMIQKKI